MTISIDMGGDTLDSFGCVGTSSVLSDITNRNKNHNDLAAMLL